MQRIFNMNIGTTSLDSLPMSPQSGDNIRLDTYEQNQNQNQNQRNTKIQNPAQDLHHTRDADLSVMQNNLNQFVTGLQQASASGATMLPSRDIPTNQEHISHDVNIKPNYIPQEAGHDDYIQQHQTNEDIIRAQANKQQKQEFTDYIYEEVQVPVLIGVLYFLFQLPIIRRQIFKFLPTLFNKDGNPNLSGYIFNSVLFGLFYYVFTKGIRFLDK